MRVRVRGTTYESVRECALALDITEAAVYSALSRGNPDSLGLGKGMYRGKRYIPRKKPFSILGMTWPSQAAAARAMGVDPKNFNKAYKRKPPAKFKEYCLRRLMENDPCTEAKIGAGWRESNRA